MSAAQARTLHLLLALANFAVGVAAFMVIGMLSPIAGDFAIPHWEAGWMMTIYAVVYALTSPVLVSATGRFDRRAVLTLGLGVLALGALLCALAPSYQLVLAGRAVMAGGAGLVTPVTTAIAVATVAPEHRGRALATVFGGFTIAQTFGVPAGVWLGYQFGWRLTFVIVASLAVLVTLVLRRLVPKAIAVQPTSLATLAGVLATPALLLAVLFTACFMAGAFTVYTYLAPFLEERHGLGAAGITAMLVIFGIGGVIGNALGGLFTDRIGASRTLVTLGMAVVALVPFLTLLHWPPLAMAVMVLVWSVLGWSANVAQQARLAALDPKRAPVLLALNASAIYVGTSIGSAVGGQVIARSGYDLLGPAAASLTLLSLLTLAAVGFLQRGRPVSCPAGPGV
ncbi:MFS transporter [Geminicoccus roseus]|uniref:MFS transporter n=1 Tax=Geminicoccus roseus TaxID=404900 RepID=UPI00040E4313|nr:MFS transporter [Geminicoccus roseus]